MLGARAANIDSLRAVAALLVVVLHVSELMVPLLRGATEWDRAFVKAIYQFDIGRIGVIAFFGISGFLIPSSLRGRGWRAAAGFAVRRVARVYPAFWLSIPCGVFAIWYLPGRSLDGATMAASASMVPLLLGQTPIMGHYWTLEVELVFYASCLVLFGLGFLQRAAIRVGVALLCLGLGFSLSVVLRSGAADTVAPSALSSFHIALLFGLGVMFWASVVRDLADGRILAVPVRWLTWSIALWLGALMPLLGLVTLIAGVSAGLSRNLLSNGLGVTLFILALQIKLRPNLLSRIGESSYSLYLFHPVPLYIFAHTVSRGWLGLEPPFVVVLGTLVAVSILLGHVVHRLVEQPCYAAGQNLARRIERQSHG